MALDNCAVQPGFGTIVTKALAELERFCVQCGFFAYSGVLFSLWPLRESSSTLPGVTPTTTAFLRAAEKKAFGQECIFLPFPTPPI